MSKSLLSLPLVGVTCSDDDWTPPVSSPKLYRAASVGNSWGVTSIGRGFDWAKENEPIDTPVRGKDSFTLFDGANDPADDAYFSKHVDLSITIPFIARPATPQAISNQTQQPHSPALARPRLTSEYFAQSPAPSPSISPQLPSSTSTQGSSVPRSPLPRSPTAPRPRRRSSQQRVSLIAGRVSIAPIEPPSPPPALAPSLQRADSSSSFLSCAASTAPPSPLTDGESFLGGRSILDFSIEGDIGRGAYGLVKRAREIQLDGSLGPPLVIKQIIKSRILADCWKRHPKHGTIPIEIYVMSAVSSLSFVLPLRRPWDPSRPSFTLPSSGDGRDSDTQSEGDDAWVEGRIVKGHPNICPLLDFFEDSHYYYLILPSTTPDPGPNGEAEPSDLFDLVEAFSHGLQPGLVRSYLGQIADALCFLHARGIVHRDVKDENVVLGKSGRCILIDFGSSGLVKKNGWDTFSGTLDYAGPEILRGERYHGKEQDVWAFGVVAYVLLCGECPFMTAAEAQEGLRSPFATASIALDERCAEGQEFEGKEPDGGGALGDAAALVRACLEVEVSARPTFEKILQCRFLCGHGGWGMDP